MKENIMNVTLDELKVLTYFATTGFLAELPGMPEEEIIGAESVVYKYRKLIAEHENDER